LACPHCFVPNEPAEPSWEALQQVLAGLQEAGCRKLILTGGEPLLRKDLVEIIRAATGCGIGADLNSNLVGLAPARADALVAAGLAEASVSLYGDQVFHDTFVRHAGAYESVLQACRLLRERGVALDFHGPVWAENLSHAEHVFDLAETVGGDSLTFFNTIAVREPAADRVLGEPRFGAAALPFHPPALDALAACVQRLRARQSIPVRTIGFWGCVACECEQGSSIVGLASDLQLSPCLLSRRRTPASPETADRPLPETLRLLREEVRQGLWRPACCGAFGDGEPSPQPAAARDSGNALP
jgi:hypothetical protein